MATRFSVSLAHAGCNHTGFVVWEEREQPAARGLGSPTVVGLPRGFVSLNTEDGVIEIVCAGCRQTIAAAARADPPNGGSGSVATDSVAGKTSSAAAPILDAQALGAPELAAPAVATPPPAVGEIGDLSVDAAAVDKVHADIEALFAEAEDVAPIRGDAIPQHLLDKLRHLSDRMRRRREE